MASLFPSQEMVGSGYPGPVLGSDFPVEPPNPFHGMFAAVTRLNPATGTSPSGEGGWYPQEALTVEQALHGFTKNAAYGWFQEDRAGAIEVGRWADFIVVDKNIWEDVSGRSLKNLTVRETWMGGRKVYPRQDFQVKGGPKASFKEAIMAVQTSLAQLFKRIMGGTDQEL
jgi:predicted amidohydrolase YtcJ